ncbi:hypothetical protein V6N13_060481 [Hibiscus sabdariffa]
MVHEANALVEEVKKLQNNCVGNMSAYRIEKQVRKKTDSVMELLRRAKSFYLDSAIVSRPPRKVCGRAGGRKTTHLKKVSNEFYRRSHDFDCVIWTKVPREQGYVERVQELIRKKLDIPDDIWNQWSEDDEKAAQIFSVLKGTKFVLLLDNVWEDFDLLRLGFHLQDDPKHSKVISTTSGMQLFLHIGIKTQTVIIHCLPPQHASTLFWRTVGERVRSVLSSDPDLLKLANKFARRGKGLPLALLAFARALACLESRQECRYTTELSGSQPSQIESIWGCVFPREGFLDGPNPHDLGAFIMDTLESAYLLEIDESKQCVEMYDMIRHVALWLARDQGRKENNVFVSKGERLTNQKLAKWRNAKWISMFGCISTNANLRSPSCPNLTTLILRDGELQSFPDGLFDSMPTLKVLDLLGNRWLTELPSDVGNVTTLHYINLSFTSLAELPLEI